MDVTDTLRGRLASMAPGRVPVSHMLARRGEMGVAVYLLMTGFGILFAFDLNSKATAGHGWMLKMFDQETWAGLFIACGSVALFGTSLAAGRLRSICTTVVLAWLLFLLLSSLARHALPLVSCAQIGFVVIMGLTFFGDGTP